MKNLFLIATLFFAIQASSQSVTRVVYNLHQTAHGYNSAARGDTLKYGGTMNLGIVKSVSCKACLVDSFVASPVPDDGYWDFFIKCTWDSGSVTTMNATLWTSPDGVNYAQMPKTALSFVSGYGNDSLTSYSAWTSGSKQIHFLIPYNWSQYWYISVVSTGVGGIFHAVAEAVLTRKKEW